jgi:hypothetical protein
MISNGIAVYYPIYQSPPTPCNLHCRPPATGTTTAWRWTCSSTWSPSQPPRAVRGPRAGLRAAMEVSVTALLRSLQTAVCWAHKGWRTILCEKYYVWNCMTQVRQGLLNSCTTSCSCHYLRVVTTLPHVCTFSVLTHLWCICCIFVCAGQSWALNDESDDDDDLVYTSK